MNVLVDTQLLLWAAAGSPALPSRAVDWLQDPDHGIWFSSASIWEVAVKRQMRHPEFRVEASVLRAGLLANDYAELPVSGAHSAAVAELPLLHADPFDRMLIAQSRCDGMLLITADPRVADYGGPVALV